MGEETPERLHEQRRERLGVEDISDEVDHSCPLEFLLDKPFW